MDNEIKFLLDFDFKNAGAHEAEEWLTRFIAYFGDFKDVVGSGAAVVEKYTERQKELIEAIKKLSEATSKDTGITKENSLAMQMAFTEAVSYSKQIQDVINQKRALSKTTEELTGEIKKAKDQVASLSGKLLEMKLAGKESSKEYESLAEKTNSWKNALMNLRQEMESLKNIQEASNGIISVTRARILELNDALDQFKTKEELNSEAANKMKAELEGLNNLLVKLQKETSGQLSLENALNTTRQQNIKMQNEINAIEERSIQLKADLAIKEEAFERAVKDRISIEKTGYTVEENMLLEKMQKEEEAFDKAWAEGEKWQRHQEELYNEAFRAGETYLIRKARLERESFDKAWEEGQRWLKNQEDIYDRAWRDGEEYQRKQVELAQEAAIKKIRADQEQFYAGERRAREMNILHNAERGSIVHLENEIKNLEAKWASMGDAARRANSGIKDDILKNKEEVKKLKDEISGSGGGGGGSDDLGSSLKNYLAAFISIYTAIDGIKKAFDIALKFDAIQESLSAISRNDLELAFNLNYTRELANELGIEFETLVGSFKNFSIALKDTNLEGQRTKDIFTAVSKAAVVLKLPTESVQGVFLALEQIASKGTVSMEELRKQLGNRLPGAFNLFAEGLGLTTKELNAFVKEGKITKDALVPFAEMLEKKFGGSVEKVADSMPAQLARIANAFKSLFQNQSVINGFKAIIDNIFTFAKWVKDLFASSADLAVEGFKKMGDGADKLNNKLSPLLNRYDELRAKTNLNVLEQRELESVIKNVSDLFPGAINGFDLYGNALDINRDKVNDFINAQEKMRGAMQKTALKELNDEIENAGKHIIGLELEIQKNKPGSEGGYKTSSGEKFRRLFGPQDDKVIKDDGTLTDKGKVIFAELQEQKDKIIKDAREILEIGGTLSQKTIEIVNRTQVGASEELRLSIEKMQKVNELNAAINSSTNQAASLVGKNQELKRDALIKQIKDLRTQVQELLYPGSTERKDYDPYQDSTKKGRKPKNPFEDEMRTERDRNANNQRTITEDYQANDPYNTYEDDIAYHEKQKAEAERFYKAMIALRDKYEHTTHETAERYKQVTLESDTARKTQLNAANKAEEKIYEERQKNFNLAVHNLEDYNRKVEKLNREFELAVKKHLASNKGLENEIKLAKKVNPFLSVFGQEDEYERFKLDQENKQVEIDRVNDEIAELERSKSGIAEKADLTKQALDVNSDPSIENEAQRYAEAQKNDKTGYFKVQLDEYRKYKLDEDKLKTDLENKATERDALKREKELNDEKRKAEIKKEIYRKTFDFSQMLANREFEAQKARIANQMAQSQANYAFELQMAGNNNAAKMKLAQRQQSEMKRLKSEEARIEKQQAIFNIILHTAEGEAAALKKGLPAALPLVALTAAMGIAELAIVSSQPLPSYFRGRKGGPAEKARINELGPEIVESKGKYKVFGEGKETIASLEAGDIVHTHEESKKLAMTDSFLADMLKGQKIYASSGNQARKEVMQQITKRDMKEAFSESLREMKQPSIVLPADAVVKLWQSQVNRNLR